MQAPIAVGMFAVTPKGRVPVVEQSGKAVGIVRSEADVERIEISIKLLTECIMSPWFVG